MSIIPCRQVELIEASSEALLVCWIPTNELTNVKVGTQVELKGIEGRIWTVHHIYKMTVNDVEKNKLWGLNLPKKERTEI